VRKGKHGARSTKQAIAIGLSKARREGVNLPPPPKKRTSERTRSSETGTSPHGHDRLEHRPSAKQSRAASAALKRESRHVVSSRAGPAGAELQKTTYTKANAQRSREVAQREINRAAAAWIT